jgi:hypothetical protein
MTKTRTCLCIISKISALLTLSLLFSSISLAQRLPLSPNLNPDVSKTLWEISQLPDLVITDFTVLGSPREVGNRLRIPVRVRVKNVGKTSAGRFKVSISYRANTSSSTFYVARFATADQDGWYPMTRSELAPDDTVTFRGTINVSPSSAWQLGMYAEADSCSGDEFMPDHCRVREWDESNNMIFRVNN